MEELSITLCVRGDFKCECGESIKYAFETLDKNENKRILGGKCMKHLENERAFKQLIVQADLDYVARKALEEKHFHLSGVVLKSSNGITHIQVAKNNIAYHIARFIHRRTNHTGMFYRHINGGYVFKVMNLSKNTGEICEIDITVRKHPLKFFTFHAKGKRGRSNSQLERGEHRTMKI